MTHQLKSLLNTLLAPKLTSYLQNDPSDLPLQEKVQNFLSIEDNEKLFNDIIENVQNSVAQNAMHIGNGDSTSEQSHSQVAQVMVIDGPGSGQFREIIGPSGPASIRKMAQKHAQGHHGQAPFRPEVQLSETISNKTSSNAQLSSSLTSSFVNSETVNDILSDLNSSENNRDIIENIKRLAQLVKTDTGSDFFNEHIIIQIGSYLDHVDEKVSEAALVFHAAVLLGSLSTQFMYQAYENLIINIKESSSNSRKTTQQILKRIRLILDFFQYNFEMNQRNPVMFVADVLENFIKLICDIEMFCYVCLFEYRWFDRFCLKAHFRKHILEYDVFNEQLLKMLLSISELKFPDPSHLPHDKNFNLTGKLKTLAVVNSLEILTIYQLYTENLKLKNQKFTKNLVTLCSFKNNSIAKCAVTSLRKLYANGNDQGLNLVGGFAYLGWLVVTKLEILNQVNNQVKNLSFSQPGWSYIGC